MYYKTTKKNTHIQAALSNLYMYNKPITRRFKGIKSGLARTNGGPAKARTGQVSSDLRLMAGSLKTDEP
jgi:hypothetical protein